jgi:DNA-binding CsgD family transcriptional regulator
MMADELSSALSERERELLRLLVTGATNQQIALQLHISVNTVKAHLRNIFGKLGVASRTEATLYAIQHGLIAVIPPPAAELGVEGEEHTVARGDSEAAPLALPEALPPWPMPWAQRVVIAVVLLAVLAVAVWPTRSATATPSPNRFIVDVPRAPTRSAPSAPATRWRAQTALPTARARFAQAVVSDTLYVLGGSTEKGWSAPVFAFDPAQQRWEVRAAKPVPVVNVGAAVVEGLIYVPGGFDEQERVRDIMEVYDPVSDSWATAAPLPLALCAYAIAPVAEGFYLFGGWDGERYLDVVLYYDARRGVWSRQSPLRVPRGFAAASALNERIYLVGGRDAETIYPLCEAYDPALAQRGQDPWQALKPLSAPRAGHALAAAEGSLFAVGGGWESRLEYNERYDVAHDAWSTLETPVQGEWRTLGASIVTGRDGAFLYAVGGWNGSHLDSVFAYQASYRVYLP